MVIQVPKLGPQAPVNMAVSVPRRQSQSILANLLSCVRFPANGLRPKWVLNHFQDSSLFLLRLIQSTIHNVGLEIKLSPLTVSFTESAPLGRFSHRVAMSVCLCVCAIGCSFFLGLSSALRSHDQFQASYWSPPQPPFPTPFIKFLFAPHPPKKNFFNPLNFFYFFL